jgi:peptidoglycan/LPS O-acetylase OafA/YrhL
LGVDLFFVISGYLITKLLQDQLLTNTFSYLLFYLKRIRRIFPALLVMLCITSIAAALVLNAPDLERYAKSQLATLSFVANIYFWRTGGYFSTTNELKPLLHMWSLGVEEQFYLFFPLVLAITLKQFKTTYGRLAIIALISACSYLVNIYLTAIGGANPVFFLLPTRIWQFGFGCFICHIQYVSVDDIADCGGHVEQCVFAGFAGTCAVCSRRKRS